MTEEKKDAIALRPEEVNTKLASYKGQAHLLTPYARTKFDNIMRGFIPVIRETHLDPDPKNGEVYVSQEGDNKLALTKVALQKLSKLAGIKWVYTRRTDHREHPLIASYVAKGTMRDVDGNVIEETKSGDLDLRDGTPQAQEKTPKQLKMSRRHIAALAETKAMDRVIRALLGTKSYTAEELKKPFVILKLALDPNDDRVAKMLQEEEAGIRTALGFPEQEPERDPEDDLSELPPSGTEGLEMPPIPGTASAPLHGNGPIIDVTPEISDRDKKIATIEALYYVKTDAGKRVKDPALKDLSDAELEAIEKYLLNAPDVRKAASGEELA